VRLTECTDEFFDVQRVDGTGGRVQSHTDGSSTHSVLITTVGRGSRVSYRVAMIHRLAHEVSEVERIADERGPAEQVGQTENEQRTRHVYLRKNTVEHETNTQCQIIPLR